MGLVSPLTKGLQETTTVVSKMNIGDIHGLWIEDILCILTLKDARNQIPLWMEMTLRY